MEKPRKLALLPAITVVMALIGTVLSGQTAEPTAAPAPQVVVTMAGHTLVPALGPDGAPLTAEDGSPVMTRIPLIDSVVTPGDRVVYDITLDNQTADAATDLQVGAQIAAEVLLDPFSITGPDGMRLDWAPAPEDPEIPPAYRPVFVMVEDELQMQADLETIRNLRITIPDLAAGAVATVAYSVTLR